MAAESKGGGVRALFLALAIALLCGAPLARGAALAVGGSQNGLPVKIEASSGIEWDQDAQVYIARGNAVAKRGNSELKADTLKAYYRRVKGAGNASASSGASENEGGQGLIPGSETQIYRIDADGHVLIKGPAGTVVGDHAVYDLDRGVAVITGKRLRFTTPEEVVTARDSLEWYADKRIAVARGDAIAVRGNRRIRADVLTAYFVKTGKNAGKPRAQKPRNDKKVEVSFGAGGAGAEKIARIDASGHVVVTTPVDIGRGDYAVYDADKGIVTLLDHVTITRGKDTLRGDAAVIDLNRNISRIMTLKKRRRGARPRVEAIFVPRRESGPGAKSRPRP